MLKSNFTYKTDIEDYLNINFQKGLFEINNELYRKLTEDDDYKEHFEPLSFFNLLFEQVDIIGTNKDKPHKIIIHLKSLFIDQSELLFLLRRIQIVLIFKYFLRLPISQDAEIILCFEYITREIEKLERNLDELFKPNPIKYFYRFSSVREELDFFETIYEKIDFLEAVKISFLQSYSALEYRNDFMVERTFIQNIDLEIKRLNNLLRVQSESKIEKTLANKKNIIKEAPPNNFIEIFNTDNFTKYIDVLIECEPQLLKKENERYTFVGNKKTQVSCVAYWFKELKNKGIIKQTVNRNDIARVLNNEIKNYSICGSSIDNKSEIYKRIFEKQFDKLKREIT